MTGDSLLICMSSRSGFWGLGALADVADTAALFGWTCATPMVDAGIPDPVATILATALTRNSVLSFPYSGREPSLPEDDTTRVVQAAHIMDVKVETLSRGFRRQVLIVSTTHPETAMRLFDDDYFHWSTQGMVAVLRDTADGIGRQELTDLLFKGLEPPWTPATRSALAAAGARAVLSPGVDGAVAGLLAATPTDLATLIAAIEMVSAEQGVAVSVLDETAFRDALAASS